MKFYVCKNIFEEPFDCFTSISYAKELVKKDAPGGSVEMVEVPVTADSIRLLLTNNGGYATDSKVVYEDKL